MPDEITNPGYVTETSCRNRTDRIMALQRQTLDRLATIDQKIESHVAWHQGRGSTASSVRVIGVVVSIATALGAAVWALARTVGM